MKLEISNLQVMSGKGLAVPPILLKREGLFLTPDCGKVMTDPKIISQLNLETMKLAFQTLATFHNQGCYHGRPALRDIALDEDGLITFLDLEESGVDSNTSLMARDVFLLLSELKRIPQFSTHEKIQCIDAWASKLESNEPVDELRKIHSFVRKLAFLARLVLRFKSNTTSTKILDSLDVLDKFYSKA